MINTLAGPLRQLGCIDDSSWLGATRSYIQEVVNLLPREGRATNLFSDATKSLRLGARLSGTLIRVDTQPILFAETSLQTPVEGDNVRLMG